MMRETAIPTDDAPIAEPTAENRREALALWRAISTVTVADEASLTESARIARVFMTKDGPAFDPVSFADLVEFIEELPF
jgi:hypothetical protein